MRISKKKKKNSLQHSYPFVIGYSYIILKGLFRLKKKKTFWLTLQRFYDIIITQNVTINENDKHLNNRTQSNYYI